MTAPGLWPYFGTDFRVKLSTYKVFTILGARVFVQLLLELLLTEFTPCHFIEHGRQFVASRRTALIFQIIILCFIAQNIRLVTCGIVGVCFIYQTFNIRTRLFAESLTASFLERFAFWRECESNSESVSSPFSTCRLQLLNSLLILALKPGGWANYLEKNPKANPLCLRAFLGVSFILTNFH